MILGVPVVDGHALTKAMLDSLAETVTGNNFEVCIIDNNSMNPYETKDFRNYPFPIHFLNLNINYGYYRPLELLYNQFDEAELIGLAHNDLFFYEKGWNERMEHSFAMDGKLALVGMVGSSEIDSLGGRGGGTVCFFRGAQVKVGDQMLQGQDQAAGRRTSDLIPSACLDSLFMMFRRQAIPDLVTAEDPWEDITLAHFYDRIWPVRLIEKGWHVATLGVECDHLGGQTTVGNQKYRDDCIEWLDNRNIPYQANSEFMDIAAAKADPRNHPCGNPETQMYLVAEDRYLKEYRDIKHFLPFRIHGDYSYERS
jgi:hypothetical protein